MSEAQAISELERAEHINTGNKIGIKAVGNYRWTGSAWVASNTATEDSLLNAITELQETNTNLLNAITAINRRKTNPDDNKTTTPLAGGATWTGEWIDTREYVQCVVSIITDQNSATDGLVIEQSTDGVTANMHPHKTTVNVNSPDGHHYTTTIEGNYIRVKYTNGAVAQSSFKLFITAFSTPSEEGHVHAVEYEITGDHPAQVVRSVLVAKRPDGTYENIQATQGGNLKFSLEELETAVQDFFTGIDLRTNIEGGGYVTVGTTAVELTFTGVTNAIHIESKITNTGTIWIGKSNVTNAGANALASIQPGESLDIRYNDSTNALYAVSDTAAQSVLKGAVL